MAPTHDARRNRDHGMPRRETFDRRGGNSIRAARKSGCRAARRRPPRHTRPRRPCQRRCERGDGSGAMPSRTAASSTALPADASNCFETRCYAQQIRRVAPSNVITATTLGAPRSASPSCRRPRCNRPPVERGCVTIRMQSARRGPSDDDRRRRGQAHRARAAITSTATAWTSARVASPATTRSRERHHGDPSTTGTNTPDTWSARRWIVAFEPCASATSRTIPASSVWLPTPVASAVSSPSWSAFPRIPSPGEFPARAALGQHALVD